MKVEKVYFQNSRGQKLCGILSVPEFSRIVVVMCHGRWTHKDRPSVRELSDELNKNGVSTLRFDFTGHGESQGSVEEITVSDAVDDVKSAVNFVYEMFDKLFLFGNSFGGAAALAYAAKDDRVLLLVLKAPVSSYSEKFENEFGQEGINKWKEQGYIEYSVEEKTYRVPYKFYQDSIKYNYNVYDYINISVLIVHGNKDENVPVNQSLELVKHLKNGKLEIVKGADHRFTNKQHFDKSIKLTVSWLLKELKKIE